MPGRPTVVCVDDEPIVLVALRGQLERALEGYDIETAEDGEEALELTLMGVSSAIAVIGVGLGFFVWTRRRDIADGMAGRQAYRATQDERVP